MLQKGWIIQRFDCELRYAIVGIRTKGAVTIGLLRESIIFRCSNYVVAGLRYSITRVKLACYLRTTVLYRIDRHLHIGLLYYLASWKVWTWLFYKFFFYIYFFFYKFFILYVFTDKKPFYSRWNRCCLLLKTQFSSARWKSCFNFSTSTLQFTAHPQFFLSLINRPSTNWSRTEGSVKKEWIDKYHFSEPQN